MSVGGPPAAFPLWASNVRQHALVDLGRPLVRLHGALGQPVLARRRHGVRPRQQQREHDEQRHDRSGRRRGRRSRRAAPSLGGRRHCLFFRARELGARPNNTGAKRPPDPPTTGVHSGVADGVTKALEQLVLGHYTDAFPPCSPDSSAHLTLLALPAAGWCLHTVQATATPTRASRSAILLSWA